MWATMFMKVNQICSRNENMGVSASWIWIYVHANRFQISPNEPLFPWQKFKMILRFGFRVSHLFPGQWRGIIAIHSQDIHHNLVKIKGHIPVDCQDPWLSLHWKRVAGAPGTMAHCAWHCGTEHASSGDPPDENKKLILQVPSFSVNK